MTEFVRQHPRLLIGSLLSVVLLYLLVNTSLGVFVLFDVLGDLGAPPEDFDAANGPLELHGPLDATQTLVLPAAIRQPSGLAWDERTRALLVLTDQAELFTWRPSEGATPRLATMLQRGPRLLRQGLFEAIELIDAQVAWGAGESGDVQVLERNLDGWTRKTTLSSPALVDFEVQGLAYAASRNEVFVSGESGSDLLVLDEQAHLVRQMQIRASPDVLRSGRSANELTLSGLAWCDERLFATSQTFTSLLEIDPLTGVVTSGRSVHGLRNASSVACLSTEEGSEIVVMSDHDLFEEVPAALVVSLKDWSPAHPKRAH